MPAAHFEDELRGCADDGQKDEGAKQLIAEFGAPKLLAVLLRRAKKRCRPLWQKALARSLQVLGIFILYLFVCSIPLLVGKPTLRIDYVEWLNELVRRGRDEADNARPYYEKACESNVEMPQWLAESKSAWPTDFNDVELNLLSGWLKDNRQAIEMFREGSRRAGYWSEYNADETTLDRGLVANAMEILPGYRRLAFCMRWQIRRQAYEGNVEAALSDSVALTKFAGHLQGHGLMIEQLVGIAIEGLANYEILVILERVDVPADILKKTHQQLEKKFAAQGSVISLEAEKVFWYDGIQRTFTDDGQGGGRMLARGMVYVVTDDWKYNLWRVVSFDYPDRKEMVAMIDQYFARFSDALSATPWDMRNDPIKEQEPIAGVQIAPVLLIHNTEAYTRVNAITWRMKTGREALLTVLAILRYEKAKGRYPVDLNGLVEAGYLKKLPMDVFSGKPLVYKRADDNFILYSVGPNFKDDRGISGTGISGRAKKWTDNGDTVFWPLPESQVKSQQ